ncbi:MAG: molybdenum cofactor guanylyltransferase MobA [Burkholderiaceae bacterium]
MAIPARAEITGLVLAGGRGARMGGLDKGLVELDGTPLAARVLERLAPQVGALLISANRNVDRYAALGAPVITDLPGHGPYAGPLAGIQAAFAAMRTPWLAVVPCDTPNLPLVLVERLAAGLDGARASVAVAGGRTHALCCLLHSALRAPLDEALAHGERRVTAWLESVGARTITFDDAAAFVNLNAAADLRAAARRTTP